MGKLNVDINLVKKYNVPGPRYTSYPPATRFSTDMSWRDIKGEVERNNLPGRDVSLYFHIPFCRSLCWFCGCNSVITLKEEEGEKYVGYLIREMDMMMPFIDARRRVVQVHLGGGTPTFLEPEQIRRLGVAVRERFNIAGDVEAGVEIDPRGVTREHLRALREAGFNRISMGIQDHNPEVQAAVHRVQPRELNRKVVDWISEEGFGSLNIDLMYGLPLQTVESFHETLEEVLEFDPDRFAVFNYAHVPWMKPVQRILDKRGQLPSPETKLTILKHTVERLTAGGYVYIGMDHFAKADDELVVAQRNKTLQRNFQGYSTRGGVDIYAFGMTSISQTQDVYWQNVKELDAYYSAINEGHSPQWKGYIVTPEDKTRRTVIMEIMCNLSLDYRAMSEKLGMDFKAEFAEGLAALKGMESDGLVVFGDDGFEITDVGRLLIRNVAMCFDAYLPKDKERRFSRTI
ncbi:MAG: oxygen-independent coproporphyrinogen III oxidase [Verrucomicrobia bacterium]|nr:oxygen-independent coproporphyrinogen III oxidase [Verrucomicrobiota bacterium]